MTSTTPQLSIRLFGSLHVLRGNEAITSFRSDAQRVLLAYLAAHHGVPQRRDTLAALLAPDRSNQAARKYLRNRLERLRLTIGDRNATPPYLFADRNVIGLVAGDHLAVDVVEFTRSIERVRQHAHLSLADCSHCIGQLQQSAELWRGDLLAGLNYPSDIWEAWLQGQRAFLKQEMRWVLETQIEAHRHHKNWKTLLAAAQQLAELDPWIEAPQHAIIEAYLQLGDRTAAVARFKQYERDLRAAIDLEPNDALRKLVARYLPKTSSQAPPPNISRSNLPVSMTPFFGRKSALTQISDWLVEKRYRLITLVGMGGIGKTRLALEAAHQNKTFFPDGAWFVPLAGLVATDPQTIETHIVETIAQTIGMKLLGDTPATTQLSNWLRSRKLLLVLDNWEHLIDGAGVVADLLQAAPDLSIICTSQTVLDLMIERIFEVSGLSLPQASDKHAAASSVQLFYERAERFVSRDTIVEAQVVTFCSFVDGHPLAIELAAAMLRKQSLAELLTMLETAVARLKVTFRDLPPRQRSIQALFNHTWGLLNAAERDSMRRLAVMRGQFSIAAGRTIAETDEAMLFTLYDKSLIQRVSAEHFILHSLVSQFVSAKLRDRPALLQAARAVHKKYFLDWIGASRNQMIQQESVSVVRSLQAEFDNVRAAWGHAIEDKDETLICASAVALGVFVTVKGWLREGARLFDQQLRPDSSAQAWIDCQRAYFLFQLGDRNSAESLFKQAEAVAINVNDPQLLLRVVHYYCDFLLTKGDLNELHKQLNRALRLADEQGDYAILAMTRLYRGAALSNRNEAEEALTFLQQAQMVAERHQFAYVLLESYGWQANTLARLKRWPEFLEMNKRARTLAQELDEQLFYLSSTSSLARYYWIQGELDQSLMLIESTIEPAREMGHRELLLAALCQRGETLSALERYDEALVDLHQACDWYVKQDSLLAAKALCEIGRIQQLRQEFEAARQSYEQALEFAERHERPHYAQLAKAALGKLKKVRSNERTL